MEIRRISHAMGAEVGGIDLGRPLDEQIFGRIYEAFLQHELLLFRSQSMNSEQFLEFSRLFGELKPDASEVDRHPQYPEILINTNQPKPGAKALGYGAMIWHIDQMSTVAPAMATLVRGIEVPEVGGDTMFANLYLAYEALSNGMKKMVDGLHGIYPGGARVVDKSTPERLAETQKLSRPVAQPVVRVHPETGRKALFVGEKIKQFVGMTPEESAPLIGYLVAHATRPQFVYRHRWQKNDVILWDNRCTLHIAVYDFDQTQMRYMEKTSVRGPVSGYIYDGAFQ